MKIEEGKLYSFKIKDRKQEEKGIVIREGEDWILLIHLFTDYILDGYILINRQYIKSINRTKDDVFIESVLKANNRIEISNLSIPLSKSEPLDWLQGRQCVFQIDNKEELKCWIGKIVDKTEKSIFLAPLTSKGQWDDNRYYTFRKEYIRMISFETDYINSLLVYNKILYQKE